jgi:hypothetical protein
MPDIQGGVGLTQIARLVAIELKDNLNDMMTTLKTSRWDAEDAAFWAAFGGTNPNWVVEPVADENFYVGHRPSLIEAPVINYPNCAVMAYVGRPKSTDDDHIDVYTDTCAVELMAKSENSEDEVNYRIQRMAEAAYEVIANNRSLGGYVPKAEETPQILIGDLFVRREQKSRGTEFLWQGARMEYSIDKLVGR